jgi:hypothetical protein
MSPATNEANPIPNPSIPDSLLYTNHVPKDKFLLLDYFDWVQNNHFFYFYT